eukprot:4273580-Pleurochrysis_carterae.AAC.2
MEEGTGDEASHRLIKMRARLKQGLVRPHWSAFRVWRRTWPPFASACARGGAAYLAVRKRSLDNIGIGEKPKSSSSTPSEFSQVRTGAPCIGALP